MSQVTIIGPRDTQPGGCTVVNTTSRSTSWSKGLSPFIAGPVNVLWDGTGGSFEAKNVENAWQYSKVYPKHWDYARGVPTPQWVSWATAGFASRRASRYPMGKGAAPVCSWFNGKRHGYIEARKAIYIPLYWGAILRTTAWSRLVELVQQGDVALWDFDGYNHRELGIGLDDVVGNDLRPMGHAFVLALMLRELHLGNLR